MRKVLHCWLADLSSIITASVNQSINQPIQPRSAADVVRNPLSHHNPTAPSPLHFPSSADERLRSAKMAAMFSQNPVMNGPNYSFSDAPQNHNGEPREHRFNPCVTSLRSPTNL